jgi:hypothetical protein
MKGWLYVVGIGVGALLWAQGASAASSEMEILLKKLQQKGILTSQEADEIARETKQAAAEAKAEEQKAGQKESSVTAIEIPEWVKNTKLKGDLRLRYEASDRGEDGRGTMGRGRFRLRAGAESTINDKVTAGFGLASGTGDERSANQTLSNAFTRKSVWIDYAYARYAPAKWLSMVGGKFTNPIWEPSDMLISSDVNPEGAAVRLERQVVPSVNLSFNGGLFVLDDRNLSANRSDALMYAFQPSVKWNFTKDSFVRFAPAYYVFAGIEDKPVLGTGSQGGTGTPSYVGTNTANGFAKSGSTITNFGTYAYNYNAINWGGEVGFNNPFGIKCIPYFGVMAGYISNPDPSDNNTGYLAGLTIGSPDVKKFGDWSFEYTFRRLEKDAWLDLFPDTSFYKGNTNVAGHRAKFLFGLAKNTALGLNFYDTWKLRNFSPTQGLVIPQKTRDQSAEEYLFQADFIVKF